MLMGLKCFPKLENILEILVHEFIQCIVMHHVMPQDLQRINFAFGEQHFGENRLDFIISMWGDICAMWHVACCPRL
jgi:hypothetical protein